MRRRIPRASWEIRTLDAGLVRASDPVTLIG
jgi:hypothetical protein